MTRIVLSDPALTQRVLRLANSAMYSVFGRKINTVSKAVMVLGIESIGHLAMDSSWSRTCRLHLPARRAHAMKWKKQYLPGISAANWRLRPATAISKKR